MNEIHDCRENCEGRDMFEPIKKKEKELKVQIVIDKDELSKLVDKAKAEILAEYNERFKAELEKIKADIEELMLHYDYDTDSDFEKMYGIRRAIEILDNRIKELNNEN